MEIQTIQKYMHVSPRKLRLVADMVRKMTPEKSLNILRMTPKMAAMDLVKALETVLANAKQKGMDAKNLTFKKIEINESMKMRRFKAGTRGRVKPFKRRMAHIKIVLSDEGKVISQKTEDKKPKKEEKTKE
ncbi:MAG: uL22 family ribosomal protein [Candidatus Daviesbacteria bacterium]|nr:uL22 family ribosomal protein [Candidatus Daviesbacteria bacterium]